FLRPEGSITLGGEFVPLGGGLGPIRSTLTITDNDFDRGTFAFSQANYFTNENAVLAQITVIRTNGSVGPVAVDYFSRDSTNAPIATANVDYTPVRGTLNFLAGQTNRTFTVPIINDVLVEFDENIELVLTNATGGAKLPGGLNTSVATTTLTIVDN